MSITRKCLDRKHIMNKLEQVKFDLQGQLLKCSLGQTVKRRQSANPHKSKQKTIKIVPDRNTSVREPASCKNNRNSKYHLDRSKESKESRQSLPKSTQSYFVAQRRGKRSESATEKHLRSHKSKELTNNSNIINSTFQMQSFVSTHKKKQSNFSSTIGSKFQIMNMNKSAMSPIVVRESEGLTSLLLKSQAVLQQYKSRYQALQRQNKRYKRKYQDALKKIKNLQNKS